MRTFVTIICICLITLCYSKDRYFTIKNEVNDSVLGKYYDIEFRNVDNNGSFNIFPSSDSFKTPSISSSSFLYYNSMNDDSYLSGSDSSSGNERFKNFLINADGSTPKQKYYVVWDIEYSGCVLGNDDYGFAKIKFFYCRNSMTEFALAIMNNYFELTPPPKNSITYDGTLVSMNHYTCSITQFSDTCDVKSYWIGNIKHDTMCLCLNNCSCGI